ncbi:hypothetical protein ENBRE01_0456 [Enteropsectra breve]|nr:hypothetical protein ENBRE01_0456 [Enteropsectra breve]
MHYKALGIFLASHLLNGKHHNDYVNENEVLRINTPELFHEYATAENIKFTNNQIALKGNQGENSLIKIDTNKLKKLHEFSFEITINIPKVQENSKAGIYFWMSDDVITSGSYYGGTSTFEGAILGIEFVKEQADIVYGLKLDKEYQVKQPHASLNRSHISSTILEGLDRITLKFISTVNNLKIELYDNEKLLDDSFRFYDFYMHKVTSNIHFALSTVYTECPAAIRFVLYDLVLKEREEEVGYRYSDVHSSFNKFPRNADHDELRHAVADAEFFSKYLRLVFSGKDRNGFIEMIFKTKDLLNKQKIELVTMFEDLKKVRALESGMSTKNYSKIIAEMESKIEDLNFKMGEIKASIVANAHDADKPLKALLAPYLIIFTLAIIIMLVRATLCSFILNKRKSEKLK